MAGVGMIPTNTDAITQVNARIDEVQSQVSSVAQTANEAANMAQDKKSSRLLGLLPWEK
jgi:methyl-accepting chemotaxis protein